MMHQSEQARRDHQRMVEWESIVQQWGLDMAEPSSPFGQLAEKVRRAQFRARLRAERNARGDKEIMQWWRQLRGTGMENDQGSH